MQCHHAFADALVGVHQTIQEQVVMQRDWVNKQLRSYLAPLAAAGIPCYMVNRASFLTQME